MNITPLYWNNNGKYQAAADELAKLVPAAGEITSPTAKALEKFRKASNCYYDLYNNGLCNRAKEFRKVFGIASSKYRFKVRYGYDFNLEILAPILDAAMDKIIEAAAKEQGVQL